MGADLRGARLTGANVAGADLRSAYLANAVTGGLVGTPAALPELWLVKAGYLLGPGANVEGADLSGQDLSGISLRAAKMCGAKLTRATLGATDLRSANMCRVSLVNADVQGARLGGAKLDGARPTHLIGVASTLPTGWHQVLGAFVGPRVDLRNAKLSGAVLTGLDLSGADLSGADLAYAYLGGSNLTSAKARSTVLHGANLSGTNLNRADLTGADLSDSLLEGTIATSANLSSANLAGAHFGATNIAGADLSAADMSAVGSDQVTGQGALPSGWRLVDGYLVGPGAALGDADLTGADLSSTNLSGATLTNADLSGADLSNGTLSGAGLASADMSSSVLTGQNFTGSKLAATDLGGSRMDGATGSDIHGAPSDLPAGWAIANNALTTVPAAFTAPRNLDAGAWIESGNGEFTVVMQGDGNLVEYRGGTAIWATGTSGAVTTAFQGDCNLVIYRAGQVTPAGAMYTTGSGGGSDGCTFSVANDGGLAVTTSDGSVRWARHADGTIYTHRIVMKQNAPVYNGTSINSGQTDWIPQGQAPAFVCWTKGQSVGGVDVWFYVLWNGHAGYYPSYYDDSHYAYDERISIDFGIPLCGSVPSTFTPPSNGTVIQNGPNTISAPIHLIRDAYLRSGPSQAGDPLTLMPAGTSPGFRCWSRGQVINGVDVWFKVLWNRTEGYYASAFDDSHYLYDEAITARYGIPPCNPIPSLPPAPPPPAPPAPTGPYINSPIGYASLRHCPEVSYRCYVVDGGDGRFDNGTPVQMTCWTDSVSPPPESRAGLSASPRWFLVYYHTGSYNPIYAWVWSRLVTRQSRVDNCSEPEFAQILQAYVA